MQRSVRTVGAVAAVALVAAACGEDPPNNLTSGAPPAAAGQEVTIVAENTMFDVTRLEAIVGQELAITYDNRDQGLQHNLHVRDAAGGDAKTDITEGPVTQELTVSFEEAGQHEYLCDVHPDQMQGTIDVDG